MTRGELHNAQRRALNILDSWLEVTGVVEMNTGYYYELQAVVNDAVECGVQAALGVRVELDSEKVNG